MATRREPVAAVPPPAIELTPADMAGGDWMPIMQALDKLEREHGVVRSRAAIIRAIKVGDLRGGRFGWGDKTAYIVRYSDVLAYLAAHPARSTHNLEPNGIPVAHWPRRSVHIDKSSPWAQRERMRNYEYQERKRQRAQGDEVEAVEVEA